MRKAIEKIRTIYCWLFAASSVLYFGLGVAVIRHMIQRHYSVLSSRYPPFAAFYLLLATVLAVACLTTRRKTQSGKTWGIVASMTYIVFSHFELPLLRPHYLVMVAIGVTGLAAFIWQDDNQVSEIESSLN